MITLFFIYLLSAKGAPIPRAAGEIISSECTTLGHCRSLLDIVVSSLTTIGLCTWGALHPNIPPQFPDEKETPVGYWKTKECWTGWMKKFRRGIRVFIREQIVLFIVSLLVPEYILAWAIRQNLQARKIVEIGFERNGHRLPITRVHGFFIVMGGFQLYETRVVEGSQDLGVPLQPLRFMSRHPAPGEVTVQNLVNSGKLNLPMAEEIEDRGKRDCLAKTVVIFQTAWFVAECIARGIQHLPVTELEIIALAYTTINLGIYIAWWDKPRGINYPIRVFENNEEKVSMTNNSSAVQGTAVATGQDVGSTVEHQSKARRSSWKVVLSLPKRLWKWLNKSIQIIVTYIIGSQDGLVKLYELTQVPTFWAGKPDGRTVLFSDSLSLLLGIMFGAIHCIAWSSSFPSHRIRVLWRLSAVAITGIPLFISATASSIGALWFVINAKQWWEDIEDRIKGWTRHMDDWVNVCMLIKPLVAMIIVFLLFIGSIILLFLSLLLIGAFILSCLLYIVARGTTLFIALRDLKSLPPGAYQTVEWTKFIPHI